MLFITSDQASETELKEYITKLDAFKNEDGLISLEDFIKIESWYDATEGPNNVEELKLATKFSEDTDYDDTQKPSYKHSERLIAVKTLFWKTTKRVNEPGLDVALVEQIFTQLAAACHQSGS